MTLLIFISILLAIINQTLADLAAITELNFKIVGGRAVEKREDFPYQVPKCKSS